MKLTWRMNTKRELAHGFAKDDRHIFHLGKVITDVSSIDPTSFEVLNECYSRDHERVYCTHYGYDCYETNVVDADRASFEVLGGAFARDARRLYNHGRAVPEVRSFATFRVIHRCFATDAEQVYLLIRGGKHSEEVDVHPVDGADPVSFEVVTAEYARDRHHVYRYLVDDNPCAPLMWDLQILEGANPTGFDFTTVVDWEPVRSP